MRLLLLLPVLRRVFAVLVRVLLLPRNEASGHLHHLHGRSHRQWHHWNRQLAAVSRVHLQLRRLRWWEQHQ